MHDNEFDDFFRNRLSEHVSEVPADMWERIRSKDKDRRGIILWWAGVTGSLLLFGALVGGYFLYTSHSSGAARSKNMAGNSQPRSSTILPAGAQQQGYQSPYTGITYNNAGHAHKIHNRRHLTDTDTDTDTDTPPERQTQTRSVANFSIEPEPGSLLLTVKPARPLPLQIPASSTAQSSKGQGLILAKPRQNWFMGVFLSPDMPFNAVHSNDPAIVQQIKNNQKMELSFTAGLEIGRAFGKHFSAQTGVQYSDIRLKILLDSGYFNFQDHFRSIDIPLMAGYALGNDHFKSIIKAGIIVDAYSWYKGLILTDTGTLAEINKAGYYKHFTGISLQFGVDLTERITPNLQIFAGPYFRYRLSDMTISSLPFTQKINVSGLTLGVRYNFRKMLNALTQTGCPVIVN